MYMPRLLRCCVVLLAGVVLGVAPAAAQAITDYSLTPSSGSFTALTGATTPALSGGSLDDGWYNAIPIGFSFDFNGTIYTDVAATTNGCLFPGATLSTSYLTNNLATNSVRPIIAPLWDDLEIDLGVFSYKTEGSPGAQVFTAEWLNVKWRYSALAPVISFQVKLYEADHKIEFVYREETEPASGTPTASIGLAATASGSGNFLSLTNTSAAPGVSFTTETTNLSTKPATGQIYAFTRVNMTYTSSTVTQVSAPVAQGAVDARVIGIEVVMDGALSPLSATSFTLNTTGTTSTANLVNAKLYYTGGSPVYAPVNQFGSTVVSPSGSYSVPGSQTLVGGTNYFWLAYDIAGGATVGNLIDAQCTALVVAAVTRTPTVTAPAGALTVAAPLSGTKTVGTGGDYATLIDAMNAINAVGLGGNLTLDIISDLADTAVVINPWSEAGGSGYTLTIRPSGAPRTIAGNTAAATIKINGADRVTIDGRIAGVGNNLTIVNNSTLTSGAVIWVSSPSAADSATDVTVRNCNIQGAGPGVQITAVTVSGAIGAASLSAPVNIVFRENVVTRAQNGIYMVGVSATRFGTGCQVVNNTVGLATPGDGFLVRGLQMVYLDGLILEGNEVQNNVGTSGTMDGIITVECINSLISKNRIHRLQYTGSSTTKVYGIRTSATTNATALAPSNNTYVNNLVYDLVNPATSSIWNTSGILANGGYGDKFYYNTVYLTGQLSGGSATGPSSAFSNGNANTTTTSDVLDIRDNIFAIAGTATGAAKFYAHSTQRTSYAGSTLDHNLLFAAPGGSATAFVGRINAVDQVDLASWQGASGEGGGSISANPNLNSGTNVQPLPGSPVLGAGTAIPGVLTDFAGVARGTPPSIGAYELAADVAGPAIAYTPLANTGSTANRTLTATISDFSSVGSGGNAPRLYYRKGTSGSYVFVNPTGVVGDDYTFTLDNSLIGGVTGGDVVQYYVAAQDVAGTPNGSTLPAGGSGTNPPGTTPPPVADSYFILLTVTSFPYSEDFEGASPDIVFPATHGKYGTPAAVAVPSGSKFGEAPEPVNPEHEQGDLTIAASLKLDDPADPAPVYTESGGLGWFTGAVGGGANNWVRGTPAKTYLSGAHGGTKAYVTKETGDYDNSHNAFVHSPVFDFTSFTEDPQVAFWHKGLAEVNYDALVVEQSTDGGLTWLRVDSTLGTGPTYNTVNSTYWHNNTSTSGPVPPPKFSDTTTDWSGNDNGWIRSTSVLVGTAGLTDVRLRWRFGSDGSVVREGWALDDVSITAAGASVSVPLIAGWNMVSNPVIAANDSVQALYPTASFPYAFAFSPVSGYFQQFTMPNGPGFWEKFPSATSQSISGTPRLSDSVSVTAGWNMVGSLSASFDTSLIDDPGAIRSSVWFGYNGAYFTAAQLDPGAAYWVKASAAGKFFFSTTSPEKAAAAGSDPLSSLSTVTVTDAAGAAQTLYFGAAEGKEKDLAFFAMPPLPPADAFDARFATADGGAAALGHGDAAAELVVLLQSARAPVTVAWDVRGGARYLLMDGDGGTLFPSATMEGKGEAVINAGDVRRLVLRTEGSGVVPVEFALDQNYPNPFNPSTTMRFALPVNSRVSLQVVNALGQKVADLVTGDVAAGYHTIEWNGAVAGGRPAASGVYFARFSATGVDGRSFADVRKLLLLK